MEKYDFMGWATKNNVQCSDGRIIRQDAFKHNDGMTVPLVWNHDHSDPYRIVGHAKLENREEGVYAYCKLNDTDLGKTARIYVQHGDITQLSIYANQLKQQGPNVMHGSIREVSLVMAGANPEAYIESVMMHGEESDEEAKMFFGEDFELCHSDDEDEDIDASDIKAIYEDMSDKQKRCVHAIVAMAVDADLAHSDLDEDETDDSDLDALSEVYDEMTDEQKDCAQILVALSLQDDDEDDDLEHSGMDDIDYVALMETYDNMTEEQQECVAAMAYMAQELNSEHDAMEHSATGSMTVEEIYENMDENQKTAVHYLIGIALESNKSE